MARAKSVEPVELKKGLKAGDLFTEGGRTFKVIEVLPNGYYAQKV